MSNPNNPQEVIPPMTHPMGKYWDQPDRSKISIDKTHALMTRLTLNKLSDYTNSQPTGVYEGKMYRKGNPKIRANRRDGVEAHPEQWFLHWWSAAKDPNMCKGNCREIIIIDE